jgi:hypothetical protein
MSARDELREYADRYGYTAHVNALIDAVVAEVRIEAADFLREIGTPITGERTEHERGVMYASERLRAMAAAAPAPVESAGDETGEAPHPAPCRYPSSPYCTCTTGGAS